MKDKKKENEGSAKPMNAQKQMTINEDDDRKQENDKWQKKQRPIGQNGKKSETVYKKIKKK